MLLAGAWFVYVMKPVSLRICVVPFEARRQVSVADPPPNRATELTNQINITLASDLEVYSSGTAAGAPLSRPDVPTVPASPAQKPLNAGPGWD